VIRGFLSDAHGNLEAFERGVEVLRASGAESIWFLGDAVGYLPGTEVVAAVAELADGAVRGNHDDAVLRGDVDANRDALLRHGDIAARLTGVDRGTLQSWPERVVHDSSCGPLLMVHGSPQDPLHGYVYPDSDLAPIAASEYRVVLMGQTHRPFVRELDGTVIVNVGSCGLPRDCGTRGAACLFDDATASARILRYDIGPATAASLDRCGPVAPEVLAVFGRRATDGCMGESYD
jgi:putative phosphoesterase